MHYFVRDRRWPVALGAAALVILAALNTHTTQAAELTNLLPNSTLSQIDPLDATSPARWHRGSWGINQPEFLVSAGGFDDTSAVRVTFTTHTSGDAKWYTDPQSVIPGQEYRFEDTYTSNVPTALVAEFRGTSGAPNYVYLASVPAASTWTKASSRFTVPVGCTSVTIFHLLDQVGSLTFDNPSLTLIETSPPSNNDSLLSNGSLESGGEFPTNWSKGQWGSLNASFLYPVPGANSARAAQVSITSYQSGDVKWVSPPFVPTSSQQALTYEDRYLANVPTKLVAEYLLANGTYQYEELANLSTATSWKTAQANFTPPGTTQQVRLFHLLDQVGTLTIDDARLSFQTAIPPADSSPNLILNADLTQDTNNLPAYWTQDQWGSIQANFVYPAQGPNGSKALQVHVTSQTSGDAKWAFDPVQATPNLVHRYSAVYTADVSSVLGVEYQMTNGTYQYETLKTLPAASTFSPVEARFSPPNGALRMTVSQRLEQPGTLTTAQFQLPTPSPSDTRGFNEGFVTLTFDDGFLDSYTVAAPLLRAAGVRASFFLMPDYLLGDDASYMRTTHALLLQQDGHEIGSHTNSHAHLSELSGEALQREVSDSRQALSSMGLGSVDTFVYPYGEYSDEAVQAVHTAGYIGARSVQSGFNDRLSNPYLLKDQHIESDTTIEQVNVWIAQAKNDRTWLILELHQQNAEGGQYSNTPAMLQAILGSIQAQGLRTMTLREGLALLRH